MIDMNTIGATELRDKVGEVLDEVRYSKKPYAITRFGKVVAYVVPADVGEGLALAYGEDGEGEEPRVLYVHGDGSVSGGDDDAPGRP